MVFISPILIFRYYYSIFKNKKVITIYKKYTTSYEDYLMKTIHRNHYSHIYMEKIPKSSIYSHIYMEKIQNSLYILPNPLKSYFGFSHNKDG